jgi:hypothetical protein
MRSIVTHLSAAGAVLFLGLAPNCGKKSSVPANVSGTWAGSLTSPGMIAVGTRFVLAEQNGQLTGQAFVEDPSTKAFLADAELT